MPEPERHELDDRGPPEEPGGVASYRSLPPHPNAHAGDAPPAEGVTRRGPFSMGLGTRLFLLTLTVVLLTLVSAYVYLAGQAREDATERSSGPPK